MRCHPVPLSLSFSIQTRTVIRTWRHVPSRTVPTYTCANASTAPDTVTIAVNTVNTSVRMAIYEYSGVATSGCLDTQSTGVGNSTAVASGSITPSSNNELVMAWGGFNTGSTVTGGTSFTVEDQVPSAAGSIRMEAEAWIQTTATATAGAFTLSTAANWVSNVAAFKPAGAAAPTCSNSISLMGVGCKM